MPEDGEPASETRTVTQTVGTRAFAREQATRAFVEVPPPLGRAHARPVLPPLPSKIGRYRPLRELGRGGMGVVYVAEDPQLGRQVAIKLLSTRHPSPTDTLRLRREAQAIAHVSHPNVVQVYETGVVDERVYIAMELVAGESLRRWLRQRRRTLPEILDAYLQAGEGLVAVHERGLIHRDFKPDNAIRGTDGRVRVLDFGLARADVGSIASEELGVPPSEAETTAGMLGDPLTRTGAVVGTPPYMAPELHRDQPASEASDQFAFCVALYEAVYGQRPFPAKGVREVVMRVLDGVIAEPPAGSDVPPWLRRVLLRGLAPQPEARWPSMRALLTALREGQRPRAGRAWLLGLGATAALAATAASVARGSASPCADVDAQRAAIWSPAHERAIAGRLQVDASPQARSSWDHVAARLHERVSGWAHAYAQTCEHASPDVLDERMACLGQLRRELTAFVQSLEQSEPTALAQAVAATEGLGTAAPCLRAQQPVGPAPPDDPALARRVEHVRDAIARAHATLLIGQYGTAQRFSTRARQDAQALGYPPVVAEAGYQAGLGHFHVGDHDRAQAAMEQAYFVAKEIGYDAVERRASTWMVTIAGLGHGDVALAERWAEHARVANEGHGGADEVDFLAAHASVLTEAGERDRARALYERALALQQADPEALPTRLASLLGQLGMVLSIQGHHDQAVAYQERALALWEAELGPDHPKVAGGLNYLAIAYRDRDEPERALPLLQRAVEIWTRWLGPTHPNVGTGLANIASTYRELDRPQLAVTYNRRALTLWQDQLGNEHQRVASLHLNLAFALDDAERYEEALVEYREALRIRSLLLGAEHPLVIEAHEHLADLFTRLGRADEARVHQQKVDAAADQVGDDAEPDDSEEGT